MAAVLAVVLAAVLAVCGAECPTAADLKPDNGTQLCAQLYTQNSVYYDECCTGSSLSVLPDADVPYMPTGWSGKVSSLVVGKRCELKVWSKAGKSGTKKTFSAGSFPRLQEVRRGLFLNWNNAIRSYYCKCS